MKNAFKRVVSLMLSMLMVFGVCSTAIVAYATGGQSIIDIAPNDSVLNYVSIGDSMTNGYGLDGYDAEAGVYDYGYASYANQFAAALAGYTTEEFYSAMATAQQGFGVKFEKNGITVNHAQLGLSAARPEDISFLLNLDYDSQAVVDLLDKYPDDDLVCWGCGDHSGIATDDPRLIYCAVCKWDPAKWDYLNLPGFGVQRGDGKSVDDYEAWWTLVHGDNWNNLIGYGDFWTWKELTEDYRFGTVATYIKSIYGTEAERARAAELMASRPAKPRDDGSNGEETVYVAKHYQEQIANADVISLGIGNGNFGVWLMGRITTALMDYDGVAANGVYDIQKVLDTCTPEIKEIANRILVELDPYIALYVETMMGKVDEAKQKSIKDVCTYAVVSFMVNYKNMIERILELNPDVEIVMLGLMNTYAGDDAMAAEGQITIGNILDVIFPPLNAYIAAVPTMMNAELTQDASFYYAEEYSIECLIQNFGNESFYNWEGVARDRFVTGVVGECDCGGGHNTDNAESCPDWDYGIFWELLDGFDMGGVTIERITPYDIKVYEALPEIDRVAFAAANKDKAGSVSVYLAIEDAICKSGRLAPVTLSTLTGLKLGDPAILGKALGNFETELNKIIGDYFSIAVAGLAKIGVTEPTQSQISDMSMILSLPVALSNALWTDTDLCSMLAVVARNKLGNGLGAHPSVNGHASLSEEMIKAYSEKITSQDKTLDNIGLALNWLMEYAKENYPELVLPITNIIENEEFAELCKQIEAIYEQYQAAKPEQQIALSTRIYSLLLRLNTIVAMTTSKKLENVNYYVSLGDSTLTGYGLDEYVPGMNNGEGQVLGVEAPVLLAQKLFGEGYESHFKKLDKGGIRIDDLLVWLGEDEFIDDFYVRYTMDDNAVVKNTEYYQNLFISEIEKADLITLAVGGGNVTNFVARQVDALESGEPLYEMDWSKFYPNTDMTDLRELINSMQNVLAGSLPEIDGVPVGVLASVVAESFLFGLVGFKENYTKVIDRIHEINPDAHVVIVGYFNPIDNMVIPFTFGSETTYIPLGSMFGLFQEICNEVGLLYTLQNKENTTFTAISDATTILDELGLYDLESQINGMIKQTWLTHAGPKGHEYIANQIYTSITTDYASGEMVLPPVDYKITSKSSYVALGDNKAYTEAFANYLKAYVAAEGVRYEYKANTDLIIENSSISTLAGIVAENIDVIATADLISIGYSLDKVAENTMRIVLELLIEGQTEVPTTFDWVALVGEDLAETLAGVLADIHATLIEQGLGVPMSEMAGNTITFPDVSIADAAMKAIEYFAYHTVEYAVYMPKAVQLISTINPNATIMVNTLSNPMAGAKMSMMGMEIEFGDYLDYITDIIFYESALITVMNEKVVLVPANRVETTFTNYVISLNPGTSLFKDFMALMALIDDLEKGDLIQTTANGNAYVLAKMMSALNISVEPPIRGDFNSDGSVTVADSVYLMVSLANPEKYSLNQSGDLNGDGKVDRADTTYLTRFLVSPADYPLN
ncbi:MAG: hypothetical protein IKK74_11325 [Clostridia bacterium]|nr:hypothetical protein [Clostridia bacterium]